MAPDRVRVTALSQHKVDLVKELQAAGHKVAVLTDQVNATAAMAHAEVSLALASSSSLVRESADIVLLNDDWPTWFWPRRLRAVRCSLSGRTRRSWSPATRGITYAALAVAQPDHAFLRQQWLGPVGCAQQPAPLSLARRTANAPRTHRSPE